MIKNYKKRRMPLGINVCVLQLQHHNPDLDKTFPEDWRNYIFYNSYLETGL